MSVYLIKTTEQYRCDSQAEATKLINEAKENTQYIVSKTTCEVKTKKEKGEIADEWRRVTITKEFNPEKDPLEQITILYEGE